MELGYTIIYAPGVTAAVEFYERAFTLKRRFVHESGQYAEMETGNTALGFAAEAFAEANGIAIRPNTPRDVAAGIEISFVTGTPEAAYRHAVASGAAPVRSVEMKPWEQKVSYVHDPNGCLVELGSLVPGRAGPMGMATRPEAVETILAQAVGACSVAARRMFGEYTLHANGKLVGLICDDQLFIKPTPAGRAFIGEVDEVPPYEGAKPSFLISGEQM